MQCKFALHASEILFLFNCLTSYLFHDSLRNVENPLSVKPEAIVSIIALDEAFYIVPDVLGKLLKENFRLLLCQRSHVSV